MQDEIDALERNGTWTLEELPPVKKAINCKWVYKVKYQSDGTMEQLKGRLVVYENQKITELDFNETFAPVAKIVMVCTFLAIAIARKWELH
uniref:Retrovirus-related Pol polyprotein from transposon TNT 1-94 n=1 Tax=Cajanus cajan TaxID=3821 RepID=A0A151TM18_CAJCA|nr:Retrovirus-related Pol polyprotein from transposon TNT 1-94 [Cajanus cajan]